MFTQSDSQKTEILRHKVMPELFFVLKIFTGKNLRTNLIQEFVKIESWLLLRGCSYEVSWPGYVFWLG